MPTNRTEVYIDTSSLINLLTPGTKRQTTIDYLDRHELWERLSTSQLTRLECARVAFRDRNDALAKTAEEFLDTIRLIPVSDAVIEAAMDIPFHTKSLDAIHIASMAARDVILTSDRNMTVVLNALRAHPDYEHFYDFREIVE